MAKRPLPTPAELRQLLRYEPETGKLFWLERGPEWFSSGQKFGDARKTWNARYAGAEVTCKNCYGYYRLRFFGRSIMAHRAAWCLFHGEWPLFVIDHINGDKLDNRIVNLRDVEEALNQRNVPLIKSNTSGIGGVGYRKQYGNWRAYCTLHSKHFHLGTFADKESAREAVLSFRRLHGFTDRHGT